MMPATTDTVKNVDSLFELVITYGIIFPYFDIASFLKYCPLIWSLVSKTYFFGMFLYLHYCILFTFPLQYEVHEINL
jgi:hypothetical protein